MEREIHRERESYCIIMTIFWTSPEDTFLTFEGGYEKCGVSQSVSESVKVGAVSWLDDPLSARIDRVECRHVRFMRETPLTCYKNKKKKEDREE